MSTSSLLLALLLGCGGSSGPPPHALHGAFTDPSGRPIPRGLVLVVRADGTRSPPAQLPEDGTYTFQIPDSAGPPPWDVTFAAPGFKPYTVKLDARPPAEGRSLDVKLEPAAAR